MEALAEGLAEQERGGHQGGVAGDKPGHYKAEPEQDDHGQQQERGAGKDVGVALLGTGGQFVLILEQDHLRPRSTRARAPRSPMARSSRSASR